MQKPLEERFWARIPRVQSDKCWEWKGARFDPPWDYGMIANGTLPSGKPKMVGAHRISWELHNGPIPGGMRVCHTCDNPPCVNPAHLFLGTAKDNTQDMVKKGRCNPAVGERGGFAKLTWEGVRELRRRYATEHISHTRLARELGLAQGTVSAILRGEAWQEEGMLLVDTREKARVDTLRGSGIASARLKESDIPTIRELAANGEPQRAIAARFGVAQSQIGKVIRRETWRHVA